jgi:hypothetical protein
MDKSKKRKTTQEGLQKSSASNRTPHLTWTQDSINDNHIYFNDEWNGEYEDSYSG